MNGVVLAFLSSIFWGLNGVLLRKGFEKSDVLSGTFTVVSVSYAIVLCFAIPELPYTSFNASKVVLLAVAGIISYTVGRLFTYASIASIGSSRAFSGTSTRILFSAILGAVVLNEHVSAEITLGTSLMIIGLYIFSTEEISLRGLAYSILGGLAYGVAAMFIKLGMLESPLVSIFVASSFGLAVLTSFVAVVRRLNFEKNIYLLAAGVSLALGNISYYFALSSSLLVIVIPLSNLYPIIATLLSYRLEMVRVRTFLGSTLAVVGSTLIAYS